MISSFSRRFVSLHNQLSNTIAQGSKQKFIFFFGPPGVGKGTYAQFLARDYGFNQIATGDEIRKIIKNQDTGSMDPKLVKEIREIVKSGKLVSDDIVINIIKEKLKEPTSKNGVIFDGFPRTREQLQKYEETLPTHLVINIVLEESILLEKALARRTCVGCGKSYNICSIHRNGYEMDPLNPKKEGTCDKCGDKLIIREDDTESIIKKRMIEYQAKTAPVLEVYKKRNIVFEFEPKRGVKDYEKFLSLVKPLIEKI